MHEIAQIYEFTAGCFKASSIMGLLSLLPLFCLNHAGDNKYIVLQRREAYCLNQKVMIYFSIKWIISSLTYCNARQVDVCTLAYTVQIA